MSAPVFGDNVLDRCPKLDEDANVRAGLLSTLCGQVRTQFAVFTPTTPTGAALITAGATTPTSFTTPTPFPLSSKGTNKFGLKLAGAHGASAAPLRRALPVRLRSCSAIAPPRNRRLWQLLCLKKPAEVEGETPTFFFRTAATSCMLPQ